MTQPTLSSVPFLPPIAPQDYHNDQPEWKKSLAAHADEMQAVGGGLVGMAGAAAGLPAVQQWGQEVYNRNMQESQAGWQAPAVPRIEDVKLSEPGGLGRAWDFGVYNAVKGVATAAEALGTGLLTGGLSTALGGAAARAVLKEGAATAVAKEAAKDTLQTQFGRGMLAGTMGANAGMESGQAFGEMVQKGIEPEKALVPALGYGLASSAVEWGPEAALAHSQGWIKLFKDRVRQEIVGSGDLAQRAVELGTAAKLARTGAKIVGGAAAGAAIEGLEEGTQQLMQIAAERIAKDDPVFEGLSPEQRSSVWNSIAGGAAAGLLMGGVTGPFVGQPQKREGGGQAEATASAAQAPAESSVASPPVAAEPSLGEQLLNAVVPSAEARVATPSVVPSITPTTEVVAAPPPVQPGDILGGANNDQPFRSAEVAATAAQNLGLAESSTVVPVDGGFALRSTAAVAAATEQPGGIEAPGAAGAAGERAGGLGEVGNQMGLGADLLSQRAPQPDLINQPGEAPVDEAEGAATAQATEEAAGATTGVTSEADRGRSEGVRYGEPLWRSTTAEAIQGIKQRRASGEQWLNMLTREEGGKRVGKLPGIKAEELEDLGLVDWLEAQKGVVDKEQVEQFVKDGGVRVEEVLYDDSSNSLSVSQEEIDTAARREDWETYDRLTKPEGTETKFSQYQVPGGENYRELLVTIPQQPVDKELWNKYTKTLDRFSELNRLDQGKVGTTEIGTRKYQDLPEDEDPFGAGESVPVRQKVWSLDLTPEMRAEAQRGMPLYAEQSKEGAASTTREALQSAVQSILGTTDNWRLHIYGTVEEAIAAGIPADRLAGTSGRGAYGWVETKDGKLHATLIAERIPAGGEMAALMHELGAHIGLESVLTKGQLQMLAKQVEAWATQGRDTVEVQAAKAALQRIQTAKTPTEQQDAELIAYFLEEAVRRGVDPTALKASTPLGRWFRTLWVAFKVALRRLGIKNIDRLTAQHLVDLAYGAARLELGGSVGRAPDGDLERVHYGFAGVKAETADLRALTTAQERLAVGEKPETVRKETGWHQGVDGKWRFEIDDSQARLTEEGIKAWADPQYMRSRSTLGDVLQHDALFAAYPTLRELPVNFSLLKRNYGGIFRNGKIELSKPVVDSKGLDPVNLMLHELQHAVQEVEGFALGTNPWAEEAEQRSQRVSRGLTDEAQKVSDAFNAMPRDVRRLARQTYRENMDERPPTPINLWSEDSAAETLDAFYDFAEEFPEEYKPALIVALDAFQSFMNENNIGNGIPSWERERRAMEVYNNNAGEVEARNVEHRRGLTAAERQATSPSQTQDVLDSDVIVVWNGQEMASALRPENAMVSSGDLSQVRYGTPADLYQSASDYFMGKEPSDLGALTRTRTWLQDKLYPQLLKEREISTQARALGDVPISTETSFHEAYNKVRSRTKERTDLLKRTFVDPMLKLADKHGFSIPTLNQVAYARTAQESNERGRRVAAMLWLRDFKKSMTDNKQRAVLEKDIQAVRDQTVTDVTLPNGKIVKHVNKLARQKGMHALAVKWATRDALLVQQLNAGQASTLHPTSIRPEVLERFHEFDEKPSGMTDQEARTELANWTNNTAMQQIFTIFDEMNRQSLADQLNDGLIKQSVYDRWFAAYNHYATLHREGFEELQAQKGGHGGAAARLREFSPKRAVDVFANTIMTAQGAIARAESHAAKRVLKKMIERYPEPEFWTVSKQEHSKFLDPDGFLQEGPTKQLGPRDAVVIVDGERWIIQAAADKPQAMEIVKAMRNDDSPELGPVLRAFAMATRTIAQLNTSLSPEFFFTNPIRDLLEAGINMSDSEADVVRKAIVKGLPSAAKALRDIYRARSTETGLTDRILPGGKKERDVYGHPMIDWVQRYEAAGVPSGWMSYYERAADQAKDLEHRMAELSDKQSWRKLGHQLGSFISDYNLMAENAIRFSTFKALCEAGVSDERAATIAKDLTVNFDRKGSAGTAINSLYMFANAGIQGTARLGHALARSRKVQKIAGGIVVASILADLFNAFWDDDDKWDKIPASVRERNMIFRNPTGVGPDFVMLPAPYGYNVIWLLGQEISRAMRQPRGWTPSEAGATLVQAALQSFNPIQGGTLLQTLSPTLLRPAAMIGENKDWSGDRALRPEPFPGEFKPDSQLYWGTTSAVSKAVASNLNALFGGDEVTSAGWADISPTTIDAWGSQLFGALGKTLSDFAQVPFNVVDPSKEFEPSRLPVLRKFTTAPSGAIETATYHDRVSQVLEAEHRLKAYSEGPYKDRERAAVLRRESGPVLGMASYVKETEKQLKSLRQRVTLAQAQGRDGQVGVLRKQMRELMQRFNGSFERRVQ